ncbi:MAG TPA: cysteine peptidase family C39 domain-containing protein [Kiritimatiellia bacterium]|nr:cysteine peptidase family C39 domain-containing protein [Kiritimatiellia bacterium]HPS06829.1 cysteine peptidase family C39 domain-containing protein [Kiritimatiellia bacterium]
MSRFGYGRWLRPVSAGVLSSWALTWAMAQQDGSDLGACFQDPAKWALSAEAFMGEFQSLGFRFVDGKQTAMSNQKALLRFLGLEVFEARVYFDPGAVRRVELSLYNKGDAGAKDREAFEALAEAAKAKIVEFAQEPGMTGKTSNDRANYFVRRHQWTKKSPGVQMEWAYVEPHRSGGKSVDYSAEFIRVLLVPLKSANRGMTALTGGMAASRPKNARTVKENVTRNPAGDVWVDNVPMVDQGQKGYCAAAASERVLRYYGLEVDQHQIAQLADTAAEDGTTLDGMTKAVSKIGRQFQLDKKELISSESDGNFEKSEHAKLIEQYNAAAKRKKVAGIDWQEYTTDHMVDLQAIWKAMDPEILLSARSAQKQGLSQFAKNIKLYADQGVPLLWSCLVGMYPEEPPLGQEGAFGHVRLIIGYNEKTKEILYSDSWGPSHALKRLPQDQAWAMTKGLIVLKPRDVR